MTNFCRCPKCQKKNWQMVLGKITGRPEWF